MLKVVNRSWLRHIMALAVLLFGVSLGGTASWSVQPDEILADAGLEKRARTLSAELRCLVCQNQSIDDSNAQLAGDLRKLVRERLQEGDTNDEVLTYIVARYGEFVLLKPTFGLHNLLLWLTPIIGLLGGGLLAMRYVSRASGPSEAKMDKLSKEEKLKLDQLLKDTDG